MKQKLSIYFPPESPIIAGMRKFGMNFAVGMNFAESGITLQTYIHNYIRECAQFKKLFLQFIYNQNYFPAKQMHGTAVGRNTRSVVAPFFFYSSRFISTNFFTGCANPKSSVKRQ
jgi:hypothetical protein